MALTQDKKKFITPQLWTIFNVKKTLKDLDPEKVKEAIWRFGQERVNQTLEKKWMIPQRTASKEMPLVTKWQEQPQIWQTNIPIQTGKEDIQQEAQTVWGINEKGASDLRVTKIWEVLTDKEKVDLVNKERDKIRNLEWISFDERNKMFQKLQEDVNSWVFFGGETQLARQRELQAEQERRIREQSGEVVKSTEDLFREQLMQREQQIREQWQRVMNTVQRLNSLRGAGRGTVNEQAIMEQQGKIDSLISAAQKESSIQLQLRKMEIEWATEEAIAKTREALASNEQILNQRINEALKTQLELNNQIWADFQESLDSTIWLLEAAWEDTSNIDEEKSLKMWYVYNKDGSIYYNKAWNTVEFKKTLESWEYTPEEIDAFAKWISEWKIKFSDLKLDNRDVAKVIQAMNMKLDNQPWLSTNRLKAQRIIKDAWLTADEESINTVTNLLKINSEEEVKNMISTDTFKQANFVAWNQKLFDDLRKDADSFKEIDRSYTWMKDIFNDFQQNPSKNRAAMEQALVIMFNKMLDPASVVREWEFDRTSQWQSIINTATWFLQRLESGWVWITDEAFKDIVNVAWILYNASLDTIDNLKTSYKSFASDLWADPNFVDKFFEVWFDKSNMFSSEENSQLDEIFWWSTSAWTQNNSFTTKSGFKFDFNLPDQTGWTKVTPVNWDAVWNIQKDIDRVAKNSPVTWEDIVNIANNRWVNPFILAAFLRNDSSFGTKWLGAKNNNPWNVWQFDRLWTEAVKWYATIQEGIDAAAENLQKRIEAFKKIVPNREPTALELALWKTNDWRKFFWVYMTDPQWPKRVQQIVNQLIS